MRKLQRILLASFFLAILVATPFVRADEGSGTITTHENENHSFTIVSGNLTAIFNGENPGLHFFYTSNAQQKFFIKFNSLTEFNDTDHNLAFEHNESLRSASLEAAHWNTTGFYNAPDGAHAIDFTTHQLFIESTGHMEDDSWDHASNVYNVTVTITAKLYKTDTTKTFTVGNATFTVQGGVEIKLDISISNWPFLDPSNLNDRLALRMDLHSNVNAFETHEHDGDHEVNETGDFHENDTGTHTNDTEHVAPMPMHDSQTNNNETDHEIEDHNGEGSVELLTSDGLIGGFFRFVSNAMTDGSPTKVAASYRFGEDEVNSTEQEFKLFLSYHSFTSTLVHDPSFGVNPEAFASHGVPSLLPLGVVAVGLSAAAGVLLAKRRRILP